MLSLMLLMLIRHFICLPISVIVQRIITDAFKHNKAMPKKTSVIERITENITSTKNSCDTFKHSKTNTKSWSDYS